MKYLTFILLCAIISCKPSAQKKSITSPTEIAPSISYTNLDVADFNEAIIREGSVVLDVRTPKEVADGKIENAIEINFYDADFADKVLALDKTRDYYIYCKGGGRSVKAAQMMSENGFKKVNNLEGGYNSWKKVLR